jgi:hypothetical protein
MATIAHEGVLSFFTASEKAIFALEVGVSASRIEGFPLL